MHAFIWEKLKIVVSILRRQNEMGSRVKWFNLNISGIPFL